MVESPPVADQPRRVIKHQLYSIEEVHRQRLDTAVVETKLTKAVVNRPCNEPLHGPVRLKHDAKVVSAAEGFDLQILRGSVSR